MNDFRSAGAKFVDECEGHCQLTLMTIPHYNELIEDAERGNPFAVRCASAVTVFIDNFPKNRDRIACFGCARPIGTLANVGVLGLVHPIGGLAEGTSFCGAMCRSCATRLSKDQCTDKLRDAMSEQLELNVISEGSIQ